LVRYINGVELGFGTCGWVFEVVQALRKEIVGDVDFKSLFIEDRAHEYFSDSISGIFVINFFEIDHKVLHFFLNPTDNLYYTRFKLS
jgi:hypothetical protein